MFVFEYYQMFRVGTVELCAKYGNIMCNTSEDYTQFLQIMHAIYLAIYYIAGNTQINSNLWFCTQCREDISNTVI